MAGGVDKYRNIVALLSGVPEPHRPFLEGNLDRLARLERRRGHGHSRPGAAKLEQSGKQPFDFVVNLTSSLMSIDTLPSVSGPDLADANVRTAPTARFSPLPEIVNFWPFAINMYPGWGLSVTAREVRRGRGGGSMKDAGVDRGRSAGRHASGSQLPGLMHN